MAERSARLSEKAPTPVLRIGINDVFGESGTAAQLVAKYGLDGEGIYEGKGICEITLCKKRTGAGNAWQAGRLPDEENRINTPLPASLQRIVSYKKPPDGGEKR